MISTHYIYMPYGKVENQTQDFLKKIKSVETGISSQINYLNQVGIGAPHEGAAYGAIRDRQATVDRVAYLCGVVSSAPSMQNPGSSTFLPSILKNEQRQQEPMQF
uniref:Mediator of RNA polymerase II transcription subunit 11 n=1 Tax=Romanomermis culicivorax TaxID=13658 RepID=A0A915KDD4_ROMCU